MAPLRCIHVGVGGRGAWPVQVISQRDDYESVALVRSKPLHHDPTHATPRPTPPAT